MALDSWRDIYNYRDGHKVEWMRSGQEFFKEFTSLILSAKKNIHLQFYLIDPDETGIPILNALKTAAQNGVKVYLVVDDFGSGKLKDTDVTDLETAGVEFRRFEPFIATEKFYVGRRMHHKILVIDEKIAIVAGMNIANRYSGFDNKPAWLDYGVKVEGPVCAQLVISCKRIIERNFNPSTPRWPRIFTRAGTLDTSKTWVRIRKNDWLRNKAEITLTYNRAARLATESITIVGGYFLPGSRYRKILANAARRGVDIRIIMTHFSDVPVVKYASDYLYGWLMRNKIRIYETNVCMVHGKVAIVDETWATIGSYNQNHLSAYLSIELNLDVVNKEFATNFNRHLLDVIHNECTEVTTESYYRSASAFARLRRWVSYQIVRISLRVLFLVNRIFIVRD